MILKDLGKDTLDIQCYLLRFGVLGIFLGSKYRTSGGGPGCLGVWKGNGKNS